MKISILITSFKEPKTIGRAIKAILNQNIKEEHEIIVSAPDKETLNVAKKYKQVKIFKDPGKGKSYALNLLFSKLKGEILIFTDGDVYLGKNAINEIIKVFRNKKVGIVTGRPASMNSKKKLFGYWSHLLTDAGAHKIRKKNIKEGKFIECSGYLFAFKNKIIKKIPLDVAEDAYIPYIFWKKGYKIGYAERAKVYVKYPNDLDEWLKQKVRTSKAHETLERYAKDHPKIKSFKNEVFLGTLWALSYPRNLKEVFWTFLLFLSRFYMWLLVFKDTKIKKRHYQDAWERVESTK